MNFSDNIVPIYVKHLWKFKYDQTSGTGSKIGRSVWCQSESFPKLGQVTAVLLSKWTLNLTKWLIIKTHVINNKYEFATLVRFICATGRIRVAMAADPEYCFISFEGREATGSYPSSWSEDLTHLNLWSLPGYVSWSQWKPRSAHLLFDHYF